MKTMNNNQLLIFSMGKMFQIRLMTTDQKEANDFMEKHPETSCIDETENGIIIIADNNPN